VGENRRYAKGWQGRYFGEDVRTYTLYYKAVS
jgi:hypothetical protein